MKRPSLSSRAERTERSRNQSSTLFQQDTEAPGANDEKEKTKKTIQLSHEIIKNRQGKDEDSSGIGRGRDANKEFEGNRKEKTKEKRSVNYLVKNQEDLSQTYED